MRWSVVGHMAARLVLFSVLVHCGELPFEGFKSLLERVASDVVSSVGWYVGDGIFRGVGWHGSDALVSRTPAWSRSRSVAENALCSRRSPISLPG